MGHERSHDVFGAWCSASGATGRGDRASDDEEIMLSSPSCVRGGVVNARIVDDVGFIFGTTTDTTEASYF